MLFGSLEANSLAQRRFLVSLASVRRNRDTFSHVADTEEFIRDNSQSSELSADITLIGSQTDGVDWNAWLKLSFKPTSVPRFGSVID